MKKYNSLSTFEQSAISKEAMNQQKGGFFTLFHCSPINWCATPTYNKTRTHSWNLFCYGGSSSTPTTT